MEQIKDFKISSIPLHKIVFVTTSDQDLEMDRTMLVENYPNTGDYTIAHGGHCSCYGFDDTEWEACKYTEEELVKLCEGWVDKCHGSEKTIAPLILNYI